MSRTALKEIVFENVPLVSSEKAAEVLGLSILTIRNAYRTGRLPGIKIGRTLYFKLHEVKAAFVKRGTVRDVTDDM